MAMTTKPAAHGEMTSAMQIHMYTMVPSYHQEPSEIPEEILINKQNTEIAWSQNILLTNTTNQQQIAAILVLTKNKGLLTKFSAKVQICSKLGLCREEGL